MRCRVFIPRSNLRIGLGEVSSPADSLATRIHLPEIPADIRETGTDSEGIPADNPAIATDMASIAHDMNAIAGYSHATRI